MFCFASIALTAAAAPALSDRDAKALVEKSWNALSWSLPMGKFDVAKDGSQRENTIPEIAYQSYRVYEKFGVNEYRLPMVTHESKMKSPFAEVSAEINSGKSMSGKRKAIVLFKCGSSSQRSVVVI